MTMESKEVPSNIEYWISNNFGTIVTRDAFIDTLALSSESKAACKTQNVTCSIVKDTYTAAYTVQLKLGHLILIGFTVQPYPACCAMWQLHHFMYQSVNEKLVHEFMQLFFDWDENQYIGQRNQRYIVAMVESRYNNPIKGKLHDYAPIENPEISYKYMYTWFKKQRKCKTTSIMYNTNTQNLIHLLEVVL